MDRRFRPGKASRPFICGLGLMALSDGDLVHTMDCSFHTGAFYPDSREERGK
ncbi:MAG: hypothetical protein ACQEXV_07250 [Bacillota bacterium]